MKRTAALLALGWLVLGSLVLACLYACGASEPCAVPGVATPCNCGDGAHGARACLPSRRWSSCDCSGRIALPNLVAAGGSGAAGTNAGGTGGSGATGGSISQPKPDTGVPMTVPPGPDAAMIDAGLPPVSDAAVDASVDAEVDAGPPEPLNPYRGCMGDSECDPGGLCVQTPSVPGPFTVCAPVCVNTSDCFVPAGTYDARVTCVTGYCALDCTPLLFLPLLSCPDGMACITDQFGNSFCHDDGS